ncbi:MAG: hypothetical protein HC767_01630 [Akkermansiaceae bacterium]|nr:hypothetical protein [Akkermansiaceae bacterium]
MLLGGYVRRDECGKTGFQLLDMENRGHIFILFGASAWSIDLDLQEIGVSAIAICDTLEDAVEAARRVAAGVGLQTVILSPGGMSYDAFDNFEDRGDKFTAYARGSAVSWPLR